MNDSKAWDLSGPDSVAGQQAVRRTPQEEWVDGAGTRWLTDQPGMYEVVDPHRDRRPRDGVPYLPTPVVPYQPGLPPPVQEAKVFIPNADPQLIAENRRLHGLLSRFAMAVARAKGYFGGTEIEEVLEANDIDMDYFWSPFDEAVSELQGGAK